VRPSAASEPGRRKAGAVLTVPTVSASESETLELVVAQCERFVRRSVDSARIDSDGRLSPSLISAAAEVGLFGLSLPEEYGGLALSMKATGHVVQTLARADRSVAIMVGLHAGLGTRPLVRYGSESLRLQWLGPMARGEVVASFAATEPGAGSDLSSIRTTLRREGTALQLDGEKSYVTNGGFAGAFTVLARSPGIGGARAHSMVLVPGDAPGVVRGPEEHKLGIRGSSTVGVHFDRASVSAENILGEPGRGMDQAHAVLAWGRTLMSYGCVGAAQAALGATLAHVTTRRQFGRSIGDFGATRMHTARMAATVFAMESLVRHVADLDARTVGIDDASVIAKVYCSEGAFDVCDQAIQLHGALGFIEDTGVARMMRDARVTRIFEGANDVLLVRLGVALVATRRDSLRVFPASESREFGRVQGSIDALERRVSDALESARVTHGVRAVHQQVLLQRLARAAIALRVAEVAVCRAIAERGSDEQRLGVHAAEQAVEVGETWLDRVAHAASDEASADTVAQRLYARHGTPQRGATPEA